MENVVNNKFEEQCPRFDSSHIDRFKWKDLLPNVGSYLWRGFKYRTISLLGYAARYDDDVVKGYCQVLEVEHRINSAYRKMLRYVRPEMRPEVKNIYDLLKLDLAARCKRPDNEFIQVASDLEKEFKSEDTVVHQIAQKLMTFYRQQLQSDLKGCHQQMDSVEQKMQEEVDISKGLPSWKEMIEVVSFDHLASQRLKKISEIERQMEKADRPNKIYMLRENLREYVSHRISTSFDEKTEGDQRAEALEYFVRGMAGTPMVEKKPLQEKDQLFGVVLRHQKKGVEGVSAYRWDLCKHMRSNEWVYRPRIESLLMNELNAIKQLSSWEKCASSVLRGYPEGSNIYENFHQLWEIREDPSFNEKAAQFVNTNGFKNYMSIMEKGELIPRVIEIQAIADKENINVRLYTHFCEEKQMDFNVKNAKSTLSVLLDGNGFRRIETK